MLKFLKLKKTDLAAVLILILSSLILLVDSLIYSQQAANMDGITHVTNMAIFDKALSQGDFPVRWTDGFANYGLPIGSFAQQMTSYIGGFLTLFTHNPVVSFNLVNVVATILSVLFFYIFLRIHFRVWPSFLGAFLFNFAPYRIINLYIRGAIPEYFSSVFLALILIFIHFLFKKKSWWSYVGLSLSVSGIILSHPMNVVTSAFFIVPYIFYLLLQGKDKLKTSLLLLSSFLLGLTLSSYYVVPLLKDIKFFYYGIQANHYTFGSTLGLKNFIDPKWYYFIVERNEILSRGHFIKTGLLESLILVLGFVQVVRNKIKKINFNLAELATWVGIIILFFTTIYAEPIYLKFSFLSNIQFPWRLLSTFIFIPPIIIASIFSTKFMKINKTFGYLLGIILIFIIAWNRFPQLYSKNLTVYPKESYYFTVDNLHSQNMNPLWTQNTTNYPVHKENKVAVLEGEAQLKDLMIRNSNRKYKISAEKDVRMIDYTFYYPGWKVLADGQEIPIEYQDINYRGVITYWLPAGDHEVEVIFTNTKTVYFANFLTIFSFFFVVLIIVFRKNNKFI